MKKWLKTLDLTSVWQGGDVPESEVHIVGKYIAKQLALLYPFYADFEHPKFDYTLYDLVEAFDNVLALDEYNSDVEGYGDFTPYEDFNARMSELYDFADANSLWVKTR
jgi:hypothetical protein